MLNCMKFGIKLIDSTHCGNQFIGKTCKIFTKIIPQNTCPNQHDKFITECTQSQAQKKCLIMRIHLTSATKMWILTSLAFFYLIIQYHVSNTWPLPLPTSDINQDDTATKLWIRNLIGDTKMADALYSMTGEKFARELAVKISRTLEQHSCLLNLNITNFENNEPPIYIVTPTYRRPEQAAELTRMAQTLMHLPNIYWLVVEDAKEKSEAVSELLRKTGMRFIHLTAPYPVTSMTGKFKGGKAKGVANRIRGLKWIRENVNEGILYFADDDNTYDIELFKEMRSTQKVSMWPVGLVTQTGVSSPIVKDGQFHGFYDGWIGGRKFPVDMAGFAVNIKFLKQRPRATMAYKSGYEEDSFLQSLAPFEPREIEFKANNCTKILVWHTQTKKNAPSQILDKKKYAGTNIMELKKHVV